MENPNNRMTACGRLERAPELSHEVMNEPFYTGTLLVKRLSGAVDRLPVTLPGKLIAESGVPLDSLLLMTGQVRSYNKVIEGAGRLMITLFAQSVTPTNDNETLNRVELCGALFALGAEADLGVALVHARFIRLVRFFLVGGADLPRRLFGLGDHGGGGFVRLCRDTGRDFFNSVHGDTGPFRIRRRGAGSAASGRRRAARGWRKTRP